MFQPDDVVVHEFPEENSAASQFREPTSPPRTTAPNPTTASYPVTPGRSSLQPARRSPLSVPGPSITPYVSAAGVQVNYQSDPPGSQQVHDGTDSDVDVQPRFSAAEKGKRPVTVASYTSTSDLDEPMGEEDEVWRESATPTPHTDRVTLGTGAQIPTGYMVKTLRAQSTCDSNMPSD